MQFLHAWQCSSVKKNIVACTSTEETVVPYSVYKRELAKYKYMITDLNYSVEMLMVDDRAHKE